MRSRRNFLMLSTGFGALALAGCAGITSNPSVPPTWVTALQAVGTEISAILPQLQATGIAIPAATVAAINAAIAGVQQAVAGINTASTQSSGQSALSTIETYLNNLAPLILPILSTVGVVIPGGPIISLIIASLPAIEAALNMVFSALLPATQQIVVVAPPAAPASARFGGASNLAVSQIYLNVLIQKAKTKPSHRLRRR